MRLTPNLSFGGQCEAAFKFYERCFGGKILRGHFMIKPVVVIADCVRPRASSIIFKQARKVLDLRGALTFPWAAQS